MIIASEIAKYSLIAKGEFSSAEFKPYLKLGIRTAFKFLGKDLKKKLEGCFITEFKEAIPYQSDTIYSLDEYVIFDGLVYKSTKDDNESCPPCDWEEACRFSCDDCCEAFDCLIAPLIAMSVMRLAVIGGTFQYTNGGIMKKLSRDYAPASEKEIEIATNNLDQLIDEQKDAIKQSVWDKEYVCLDGLEKCFPCPVESCDPCDRDATVNYTASIGNWQDGYER